MYVAIVIIKQSITVGLRSEKKIFLSTYMQFIAYPTTLFHFMNEDALKCRTLATY